MNVQKLILILKKVKDKNMKVLLNTSSFEFFEVTNALDDNLYKYAENNPLKIGEGYFIITGTNKFKL